MQTSLKNSRLMSVEKVEGNDELLMAILVRLPPKSIFKFKCVSKRWNNIIIDPYFLESYSSRTRNEQLYGGSGGGRLLAFVKMRINYRGSAPAQLTQIFPIAQQNEHKIKQFRSVFSTLIHPSGGLILCMDHHSYYFVVNPITRTYVTLPRPNSHWLAYAGLVCEDNTHELVPSFRVVGLVLYEQEAKTLLIETYSSKTGKWTTSALVVTEELIVRNFHTPFVCNGVFHWCTGNQTLAVYDSNVDENYLQLIKLPLGIRYTGYQFALTRSRGDDVIWVGMSKRESIRFWMLPKAEHRSYKRPTTIPEDEWVLMHTINNDSLSKEATLLFENKKRKKSVSDRVSEGVTFLRLDALIASNPVVAVLSLHQEIFLYDLERKSIELIDLVRCRGRPFSENSDCAWHPYFESLSLSTYAPLATAYE